MLSVKYACDEAEYTNDPKALSALAKHEDELVRLQVARNPYTYDADLLELAKDENEDVRKVANWQLAKRRKEGEDLKMKYRYTDKAYAEFHRAIEENDLQKVQELVEQDRVAITNVECGKAVNLNRFDILKYFCEKTKYAVGVLSYGLEQAVYIRNYEAIKLIISYFVSDKERFIYQDLDSVVFSTITTVTHAAENAYFNQVEAIKLIKFIINCYES